MRLPSPRTSSPNIILLVLSLGVFSTAIDQTVIYGALNDIMFDAHMNVVDLDKAAWIVIAYLIGYTAVLPLAGRISDVFGHSRVFIIGNLVFIGASAFIAIVDDFNLMIAARVVQAIGGGATVPAAMAIVAETFPAKRRAIAFGIIGGAIEAGAAVGPLFGGAVSEFLGWRWIFWADVVIGVAVITLIYFMVKNSPSVRQPIDYQSGMLIGISLALLSLGLSQQLHRTNAEVYMASFLVAAVVVFGLFIRRLLRAPDPLLRLSMFKHMAFSAANTSHLFVGGALIIALVIIPVMGYTLMELGDIDVGLRLLRLTAAIPVGAVIGGFMCHRFGYRIPTVIGLFLSSAGLFFMSRWTLEIAEPNLTLHLIICGLGFGLVISPIATAAVDSVSKDNRGIASALVISMRMIGMVIGLSLMNSLGMGHFHVAASDISVDEFEEALTPFALDIFQDFFFAAAIVCLVAIIPALWMKSKRD
jgi:EmrB/QacA subfamily drug resistance transporter